MCAFIKNYEDFIGDGSCNEQGQTLEQFLDSYDAKKYECPCVTADILVFRHKGNTEDVMNGLKVLMVKRRNHPSIGLWALPGGFVDIDEDVKAAAVRELEEETGLTNIPIQQMFTYGEAWRDPRWRIITVAYLALVDDSVQAIEAGDDAADAKWVDLSMEIISSEIVTEEGKKKEHTLYNLSLHVPDDSNVLNAIVKKTKNVDELLTKEEFEVVTSSGIAFDHPRFIVQALDYLLNISCKWHTI